MRLLHFTQNERDNSGRKYKTGMAQVGAIYEWIRILSVSGNIYLEANQNATNQICQNKRLEKKRKVTLLDGLFNKLQLKGAKVLICFLKKTCDVEKKYDGTSFKLVSIC